MDTVDSETRSRIMSNIHGKDTVPEMAVRRLIHGMGYRYRLHDRSLPGSPDLVFRSRKKAIFVNGCFWHHHHGCRLATVPKSNVDYWKEKFRMNAKRDRETIDRLESLGWKVLVIWQCEIGDVGELKRKIIEFLGKNIFTGIVYSIVPIVDLIMPRST